jgi:hypothetical protein
LRSQFKFIIKITFYSIFIFSNTLGQNIVPNHSFENAINCPPWFNCVDSCEDWFNAGRSPDYYKDSCYAGVPNTIGCYRFAHSGNAMMGVATFVPYVLNYREYISCRLNEPLLAGEKYYASFYLNLSSWPPNQAFASNNLGMSFSTIEYDSCCGPPVTNFCLLNNDHILIDSVNWYCSFGSFISDSAYTYLIIGNFYDDAHTDTTVFTTGHRPYAAYYFIDDVCVSKNLNDCFPQESLPVHFFYNLENCALSIKSSSNIISVNCYTLFGQQILHQQINTEIAEIGFIHLPTALYIVSVQTKEGFFNYKLVNFKF